jgi:hypothetical protein
MMFAAAVARVGRAPDEAAVGEFVECRNHVAAIDACATAQRRLAGRPELLQCGEQAVVVAAGVGGGEPFGQQPMDVHRGLADQPARHLVEP